MSNVVDFVPRKDAECRSWSAEPATVIVLPVVYIERGHPSRPADRARRPIAAVQIGPTVHYDAQGNFIGVSERR